MSSRKHSQHVTVPAKEFSKYRKILLEDFVATVQVGSSRPASRKERKTSPGGSPPESISSIRDKSRHSTKRVSIASPPDQPASPVMEQLVQLRKSDNYLKFPQYRQDGTVSTTILPSILLPNHSAKLRKKKLSQRPSTPSTSMVRLPAINIPKSDSKLERSKSMQYKSLLARNKKTIKTRSTNLSAVKELIIPPASQTPEQRSATRRRHKRSGTGDMRSDIPHTPRVLLSESDNSNFSAQNIQESEPGTVRLSIYYHEPAKRIFSTGSSKDGGESPQNLKPPTYPIKGLIFDKNSLCYYPPDPNPPRLQKKSSYNNMNSLADIVLFKLQVDEVLGKSHGHRTSRQKLLNAASKKLVKGRK